MTSGTDIKTIALMFQYLLIAEIVIFSICLFIIRIHTRAVYIWLSSNVIAFFASIYTLQYISSGWKIDNALGAGLLMLSSTLKALIFSEKKTHQKIQYISKYSANNKYYYDNIYYLFRRNSFSCVYFINFRYYYMFNGYILFDEKQKLAWFGLIKILHYYIVDFYSGLYFNIGKLLPNQQRNKIYTK